MMQVFASISASSGSFNIMAVYIEGKLVIYVF